ANGKGSRGTPNYDIRLGSGQAAEVMEKSSPGMRRTEIAAHALKQQSNIKSGLAQLRKEAPKAEIDLSPLTGSVEVVRGTNGLTSPDHRSDGSAIVRDFLSENNSIYGLDQSDITDLNFIGESVSPANGLRMVRVEQMVNGLPVFQSETRFILDRDGRIIRSLGSMIPNASEAASSLDGLLSPQEALRLTMEPMGVRLNGDLMTATASKGDATSFAIKTNDPNIGGDVTSKLVYFPIAPGVLTPAYSQIVFGANEDWYVLVDARDGTLLWRKNIRSDQSTHNARFRVYVQADGTTPADSPAPQSPSGALTGGGTQFPGIAPTIISMFTAQSIAASPNGWINDCPGGVCTANEMQTVGNNALVCLDRNNNNLCDTLPSSVLDGNGRPMGNPDAGGRNRDFLGITPRNFETNFLPPPQGGNPEAGQTATGNGNNGTLAVDEFRRGSVVQQFYNTNWYHDKLHALGFDQAAGNFQNNNFGGGGAGNDRVLVDVQEGFSSNNANFSTPPDGQSGRAQMYNFDGPTIVRDGGLDAEILIHELTHGTSNRILGNASGLVWDIGGSMGEGWSDFYALSLLNNTNADDPNGKYASGAYATYKLEGNPFLDNYVYGVRRFPYSTNNSINPLTWADVDQTTNNLSGGIAPSPFLLNLTGALEVHNAGEIWALTLWEVRSRIIAANGGSVPTGNQIALELVTDAMKLTPANPSFIQARDALITADCASNACANEESIWNGFADRGLGYRAKAPNSVSFAPLVGHIGVAESFQAPNLDPNTVAVDDTIGNSSGFVDPNEPVRILVNLKNPWRNASKTATGVSATISSSTPGVQILTGSTTYPDIAPDSNANASGSILQIKAP
ncbi:MAG TPA: M36 family metallopeptidase, partial [Pyrinomonadaceae bacterium]|nr:M36 family metallopeptidase [Pyrinomonadaceae bacterium]